MKEHTERKLAKPKTKTNRAITKWVGDSKEEKGRESEKERTEAEEKSLNSHYVHVNCS